MRILFIKSATTEFGGGSKSFLRMLDGLLEKGVEPMVVFPDEKGMYITLKNRGIAVRALHYNMAVYPRNKKIKQRLVYIPRLIMRIILNTTASNKLTSIIDKFSPDIIHTNVSVIDIGYRAAVKKNIPHIYHIREYGDLDFGLKHFPSRNSFVKRLYQKRSYAISITKDILMHYGLQSNINTSAIYNGVLSKKEIENNRNKENYFLYAGMLTQKKGIEDLIESFNKFIKQNPKSSMQLYIAGSGENGYCIYLKKKVAEYNIADKVTFLGQRKDIHQLMSNAYAVIIPSYFEGFGRVAAEAMFKGSLVVGRDTAGTKEQFDNGLQLCGEEIGLRYNTQDELAIIMEQIEKNGIISYESMIKASQRVVCELYSTESHCDRVYNLYQEIV